MRLNTNSICLLLFTFLLSLGCKKKIILPSITTLSVSNIFANEATSGGVISSQGTGNILSRGVVWSTSPNPTISLSTKTTDSSGVGTFSSKLFGLSANTKYYVRAYATIATGTAYGNEVSFTTNDVNISDGLVAYYPFTGNAGDSSGKGNNGVVNGASLTTDRFNASNKAYYFSGSNSYIDIPNLFFDNGLVNSTISLWFNPASFNANTVGGLTFINTQPHNGMSLGFSYNGGQKIYFFKNSNPRASSWDILSNNIFNYTPIILNTWYHVLLIKTGLTYLYYLNGQLLNSVNTTINPLSYLFSIRIGALSGSVISGQTYETFNGKLDDIRFYNRALTQSEITYLATH